MAPRLRVLAGTKTTLTDITQLVNTTQSFPLVSDRFQGEVIVCIKDLNATPNTHDYPYFDQPERQGITWSIQVRGRFLVPVSADDVLFGNIFDRPLWLPWGSNVALKFMKFVDPTLEHDLASQTRPWALSPLISTMPHFVHMRSSYDMDETHGSNGTTENQISSPFPPTLPLIDDTSQLHLAQKYLSSDSSSINSDRSDVGSTLSLMSTLSASGPSLNPYMGATYLSPPETQRTRSSIKQKFRIKGKGKKKERPGLDLPDAAKRRAYFASAAHRQDIVFGPEDILTTDFCYGFLEFSPSLILRLPGGITFDLMRYWDGQPVRFVCCERKRDGDDAKNDDGLPWGEVFWCVEIEMGDDEEQL
ncbi:hypothetical protein H0H92_008907 [Tricholoma furcatifolium]|nr:hypothetical protein H0H92_008907 [Tricholoma furcatifolium]